MPSRSEDSVKIEKDLDKELDTLDVKVHSLYNDTYKSRIDDKSNLNNTVSDIDGSIDSIVNKINGKSITDISSLVLRVQEKNETSSDVSKSIEDLFDDNQQLMSTINVDNIRKSIQTEDYQYDLICRYMTKLEDALEIKKDNVLSADNFTKDFINISSNKTSKQFIDIFNDKAKKIKDKYKVQDLFEDMYNKASKYGEYFLYHVPYTKAFERLLKRKQAMGNIGANSMRYRPESATNYNDENSLLEQTVLFESSNQADMAKLKKCVNMSKDFESAMNDGSASVNLIFDESGIVAEPIEAVQEQLNIKNRYTSVTESYFVSNEAAVANGQKKVLQMETGTMANDGLIGHNGSKTAVSKDINGSVLYEIPRDEIFPIALDTRTVIGYIHLTVQNNYLEELVLNGYSYNSLTNNTKLMADEYDKQNDEFVTYVSSMIADQIDAKFINNNIDLKSQIFAILRYNDHFCSTNGTNNITVSFLPADDVHHFYFKLDEKTHRGISDLYKSIVPAMIYCMLYINTAIGQVSRSQDKRVYYVKQNVETNVAHTLLNVINQIKKGNMGMRQLENMNTIFNVIGRYNDYIIPMSSSGEAPIDMQVLNGQQIETPTELLERMEDAAVSSTDVPMEFVQSVDNVDYATRFTMSNSKFLRIVYKRQRICQDHFTEIFRKLYNYEYKENDQTIKVILPAPAFLAMTNSQQLVSNVTGYVGAIADFLLSDIPEDDSKAPKDAVKSEFINLAARNFLGTYIDFNAMDELKQNAIQNIMIKNSSSPDEGADESDNARDNY